MSLKVDIYKKLGSFELSVSFETENEVMALFGASGCGKSTILKCVAGILKPDRGHIILDGKTLFDSEKRINLTPQQRNVGYLFQQYALFPNMTVEQNIACGIHGKKDAERIANVVKAMHLEGMEKKYPSQLSGGQQQRTALARILIGEPDILMLDEPFSALDTHLRYQMEQEVKQVIKKFGKSTLLVSHDSDEVYRLSDRVAVMRDGLIEKIGDKKTIFMDPETINGAILTGYRNMSKVRVLSVGRVFAEDWETELSVNGDTTGVTHVAARSEKFQIGGTENILICIVQEVISNAFSYAVRVTPKHAGIEQTFVIHMNEAHPELKEGNEVVVSIAKEDLVLLKN